VQRVQEGTLLWHCMCQGPLEGAQALL